MDSDMWRTQPLLQGDQAAVVHLDQIEGPVDIEERPSITVVQNAGGQAYTIVQGGSANQVVVHGDTLTCCQVYCRCRPPRYRRCTSFSGFVNMVVPGLGLEFCCFYGSGRPGLTEVAYAGMAQLLTGYLLVGWVSACVVGARMMGCCRRRRHDGQAGASVVIV